MTNFGAGKRHFCRKRGRNWFINEMNRYKAQGWKYGCMTRCGDGHPESIYINDNYPSLLLHEDCCGGYSLVPGIIVEEVIVKKTPKFFYID